MNARPPAWLGILLAASIVAADDAPPAAISEDERAIRAVLGGFVEAFAGGDAKALAAAFTEGGEVIDVEGDSTLGRAGIEAHYADRFATARGDRIEGTVDRVHFLASVLARVSGQARLVPADGTPPAPSGYEATLLKADGAWRIASLREVEGAASGHHERLDELSWLVGDWVQEAGDAVITTSVAWSEDGNYLLRSFEVRAEGKPALKGTQRVGWDPLTRQIRAWTFDSKGGRGEEHWARSGDTWTVKSTGVRPDGRADSATHHLTRVNKDRIAWKTTDATVGGEPAGDPAEIVMVRKPPEPK